MVVLYVLFLIYIYIYIYIYETEGQTILKRITRNEINLLFIFLERCFDLLLSFSKD
jgi:hypothetical protein